jgi:methylmalonyl-CoA/ethylmalonyl-CoA epimerase
MNKPLETGTVTQVAIIVRDIEKSVRVFAEFLGTPVPEIRKTQSLDVALTKYRGKPSEARAQLAFFDVGQGLRLELIQPDEHPSTWREFLDKNGEGVHHIAFAIKGMKEKIGRLESEGMTLVQTGEYKGGRYAYVDAVGKLKTIIELLEND